jgi:hypothetical protein
MKRTKRPCDWCGKPINTFWITRTGTWQQYVPKEKWGNYKKPSTESIDRGLNHK